MNNKKQIIPIVYALDKNFVPFMNVSMLSILENASKDYFYKFYALHDGICKKKIKEFDEFNTENSSIEFIDVKHGFRIINKNLCIRDNWTETIYYRFLIPTLLSEYDKVIYIDGDTVAVRDIAKLYEIDLEDNLVGAVVDETVSNFDIFREYVLRYLNVPHKEYFNSGVLLFNSKLCREQNFLEQFIDMQNRVAFEVAPDQDFLNVICRNRVKYISDCWNFQPLPNKNCNETQIGIIHYNLNLKPWHFDNVLYENYFWDYAKKSKFYDEILTIKKNYGVKEKKKAEQNFQKLIKLSLACIASSKNSAVKRKDFFSYVRAEG